MLMTYKLVFKIDAKKEWDNLDSTVRSVFAKKLKERIQEPRIERSRLSGMKDCYKIKLRRAGFRLVYQVRDKELVVSVVAVGKRERNLVYKIASKRI
jgi:mRNA interferase RelE/StbE